MDKLMQKRVLITGSNGLLGQKLTDLLSRDQQQLLCCTSKNPNRNPNQNGYQFAQVDLLNRSEIESLLATFKPTHIIHTAAITSVEACEAQPDLCRKLNVDVVAWLADWCKKENSHLTFISTDFVFSGTEENYRYAENDTVAPVNAYGQSKVDAENAIHQSGCRAAILRTILVYGVIADRNRSNLVLWAKAQLEHKNTIRVVSDQWRMPTWVDDLAQATQSAASQDAQGIFHISGPEYMSILQIAELVAAYWNLDKQLIVPIHADDIGQRHNRPRSTGFTLEKAQQHLNFQPTPIQTAFEEIDAQIELLWHN